MTGVEHVGLAAMRPLLTEARTIAVLGAHFQEHRPAFYVPDYLASQGYRILPVNPQLAGSFLWGEEVRASLTEIQEPVDLVDVFRRPAALLDHLDEIRGMNPLPKLVWLQLGIRHDPFALALRAAGIDVVQDRCTLADHQRLGLGERGPRRA